MPIPLVAAAGVVEGLAKVAGSIGSALGLSSKSDDQKASDYAAATMADFAAGREAAGGTLNGLKFRASPSYPWMSEPGPRATMLQLVAAAVRAGYAKPSDFDPSIAQAAGVLAAPVPPLPTAVGVGSASPGQTLSAPPAAANMTLLYVVLAVVGVLILVKLFR